MNICIFGDSISWGACDYQKGGWIERLKSYCMEKYDDVGIYNLGVSGNNTNDLLRRFEEEARARKPDLIIFAIGINDSQYIKIQGNYRVPLGQFKGNLSKLLKDARKMADGVVFVGLTQVDESKTMPVPWDLEKYYDNESINLYDDAIKKFCKQNGIDYISMKEVVEVIDLEDGLHPNSQGHEKMFKAMLGAFDKLLQTQK